VEIKRGKDSLFCSLWNDRAAYGKYQVKDDTLICFSDYDDDGNYDYEAAFLIRPGYLMNLFNIDDKWLFHSDYVKEKGLWLQIRPGQIEDKLKLTRRGEVILDSKKIGEFMRFDPSAAAVQLSPPSPEKSLALCLFVDYDKGAEQAYILDMKNKKVLAQEVYANGSWVSWSSDENYAVTVVYPYEGGGTSLGVVDLTKEAVFMFKDTFKDLGARAYQYRLRPSVMGGGSGSYSGFTIYRSNSYETESATYSIERTTSNQIVFRAVSKIDPTKAATATFDANGIWVDEIKTSSAIPINLAKAKEYQDIDLQSLRWISPKIFQVRVNIKCDYYAYEREPEKSPCFGKSDDLLRLYDVQVDVSKLAVTYKRLE